MSVHQYLLRIRMKEALSRLHAAAPLHGPGLAYLQEMLLFFTHAAVTATRLAAVEADDDCPPRGRTRKKAAKRR